MSESEKDNAFLKKEDLEQLLKGNFKNPIHVLSFTSSPATKAGDNYGSTLLSFVVNIQELKGAPTKTLNIIAKSAPPTEFLCDVFDFPITFCKEMNMYKLVAPALLQLQLDCRISEEKLLNVTPQFYGARTSLSSDSDELAEPEAALLLRDLRPDGYKVADRMDGLDLKHCELVLTNLAAFHATVIALKQKKPDVFKQTVLKCTVNCHVGPKNVDETEELNKLLDQLRENVPECHPFMEKVVNCVHRNNEFSFKGLHKEPFATLIHCDLWTNNILFKYKDYSGLKIPCAMKLVDFQVTSYCSPVKDILFFLYSSAQNIVIESYYDYLIDKYYESFIKQLQQLYCDVGKFTKTLFLKEIDEFAGTQLGHLIMMTGIIYAGKDDTQELSNVTSVDNFVPVGGTAFCRQRITRIIKEFHKKGWFESNVN